MPLAVFLIDSHPIVRLGLRTYLQHAGLTVSGEAASSEEAFSHQSLLRSDLILLEVRLAGADGMEVLQKILTIESDANVLLYVGSDNPTYHARGIALGAKGLVLKNDSLESLMMAIGTIAQGGTCWTRDQRRIANGAGKRGKASLPVSDVALTQREMDVLIQLANGLTNKEIAASLKIGYETVKEHVQHVLRKLGVTDRTQAAVWAVRQKVV
jgi:DNA-binding NarL/FixJ family response regulator